jgi:hypothetical protein
VLEFVGHSTNLRSYVNRNWLIFLIVTRWWHVLRETRDDREQMPRTHPLVFGVGLRLRLRLRRQMSQCQLRGLPWPRQSRPLSQPPRLHSFRALMPHCSWTSMWPVDSAPTTMPKAFSWSVGSICQTSRDALRESQSFLSSRDGDRWSQSPSLRRLTWFTSSMRTSMGMVRATSWHGSAGSISKWTPTWSAPSPTCQRCPTKSTHGSESILHRDNPTSWLQ